jgi:hypothetical protein
MKDVCVRCHYGNDTEYGGILVDDINPRARGLKRVYDRKNGYVDLVGKLEDDEIDDILTLCSMSPYGNGYDVFVNGKQVY